MEKGKERKEKKKIETVIQVSSFYKMRSHFFVRRPSIEETTGPNWPKFCMGHPRGVTRGFIEGFLEIRSRGPDVGYLGSPRGRPKILKIFFFELSFFFTGMGSRSFESLIYAKISP